MIFLTKEGSRDPYGYRTSRKITATTPSTTTPAPPANRAAGNTPAAPVAEKPANANNSGTQRSVPDSGEPNAAVEERVGLTTFIDAEDVLVDVTHANIAEHTKMLMGPDSSTEDLKQVLNRPTFMANINWTTTQATGTVLAYYNIPTDLLAYSSHKLQKLNYNQFMNADVVFRIEAAPIQFQAGRLWLCFEPYRYQRGARAMYGYPSQFTVLSGVEYDPAKPAPVEFRVPFQSIVSSWDLPIGQFGCGQIIVYVLSPLNSSASTNSVTLSIQAWFDQVSLRVPTQLSAVTAPTRRKLPGPQGEPQQFQSAEAQSANRHVFSRALTRISRVATMLGNFPILSSVAGPVAAFTNIAARTAAFFGFAKPPDLSAPTKITMHNRAAWANADGPLPLVKLATCIDNEIDQSASYMPNPIDEMDISYVVSNPSMLNAWTWSTTDAVGTLITVIPVHPGLSTKISTGTDTFGTYATTPLGYVASMFKYWAGAMKFRMEAVATSFHAGRLMIAYIPDYDPLSAASLSITDVGDNYSVLWDITDSSHMEFEVPYLGNTPFLQVFLDSQDYATIKNAETTGLQVRDRVRKIQNGAIVVYVLNQLVAPSAASASIAVLNWVSGGKDMTFAEPVYGVYRPSVPNSTRIDYCNKWYDGTSMTAAPYPVPPTRALEDVEEVDEVDSEQVFQSAPMNLTTPGIDTNQTSTAQRLGATNFIPMKYIDPQNRARLAFGEVITNLRVLTRRLSPAYVMYPQGVTSAGTWTSSVVPPTNLNVLCFDPDYFGALDGQDDTTLWNRQIAPARVGNNNWLTELDTPLNYIGAMYVFARGSRVYGIQSNPSNVINAVKFTTLPDETDPLADRGTGTFEFRLTAMNENDSPPRQPYFRTEDSLIGYNYTNLTHGTSSATNYIYGLNSVLSNNYAIQKSGEAGCGLVVQVPPTSNYPFKLLTCPIATGEAGYITTHKYTAPRSRRFLELRYRPFSSALSGGTGTYTPKVWPMPTTIMEGAADDFSFGGLVPPPLLTKIAKTTVFCNYTDGTKLIL